MRLFALLPVVIAGCASAESERLGGDAAVDGASGQDACIDTDGDGACNHLDLCPGHDDSIDADADTVADGCDECPMADDRVDTNGNSVPDCSELQTRMIDIKSVGGNVWRGWYNSTGSHTSSNDNTITGLNGSNNYNSYFVFSLAGFSATMIASVTLELEKEAWGGDATETISIWDVTTPTSTLEANSSGNAALTTLNDLGSGISYGTATVPETPLVGNTYTIPLNAAAATELRAKLGQEFAIGLHVDTQPGWVKFSQGSESRLQRLIITYF